MRHNIVHVLNVLNKRILVISSGHSAQDHRIHDKVARTLARYGAQVKIIAYCDRPWVDANVGFLPLTKYRGRLERFLIQPWRCLKIGLRQEADVWHLHDAELLLLVPLLRVIRPNVKVIYDVHEDFPEILSIAPYLPGWSKALLRPVFNIVEKCMALTCHGIVAATKSLSERFWNRQRIGIYNLPSEEFISLSRSLRRRQCERDYDIVHLGSLSLQRAEFLGNVLRYVAEKRPSTKFLITGTNLDVVGFLGEIVPPLCEIEAKIPYGEVPSRLGNARIGISLHPFPGRHLKVAVATKVFEYLACGCAVVASVLPEMEHLLGDGGLPGVPIKLLKEGDIAVYAEQILAILRSDFARSCAGLESPLDRARLLTWDGQGDRMVEFYQGLFS